MLIIRDLWVRVAGRPLIEAASVQVPNGARVGLVGRNGTGKTTLFRVIAGELAPERGAIEVPVRARIGWLAQEAPGGSKNLLDTVLDADAERVQLIAEAETASNPHRIAEIQTRLADIDAYAAPARAAAILAGLGFNREAQQQPCSQLSGGWRMRVVLAAQLFAAPDILLLDEPTNYLDLEGTLWLEDHLTRYPHTMIVISHDRDLLDSAVNHVLHLDHRSLSLYRGGYSAFERQCQARQMLEFKLAKKREAERARLLAFVERFRAKASKARQAQSRLKRLAKLEPASAMVAEEVRPILFPAPAIVLSPPIVALDGAAVGYGCGAPVLRRLSLRIDDDDRIALLGTNGSGKSTLAKLIAGRLAASQGRLTRANRLKIGYFAQHQLDELDPAQTAFGHFRRLMPDAPESKVRARAGATGFSEAAADTPVEQLSGGEKARLLLALAAFEGPQLLILDEPTNHLDLDSRAALITAINQYPGAVILVAHDRYLLDACADRLWLVADGTVSPFDGDLNDYRRWVLARGAEDGGPRNREQAAAGSRAFRAQARRLAAEKRSELAPLRSRIRVAEAAIACYAAEIARIDAQLASDLLARDPPRAKELAKARAESAAALARSEEDWLKASAAVEQELRDASANDQICCRNRDQIAETGS
jgi:ATP-binding cassette, subfamily F, member 3